jgi:hypothetical protein
MTVADLQQMSVRARQLFTRQFTGTAMAQSLLNVIAEPR